VFDLIIRGGDLIDGSGAPRRRADLGIQGDRVVAIGRIDSDAAAIIDATGKVVTPGFIDVHTHYDAQVFWDGALTPSPFHGVTTALAGNCGFSIQPLSGEAAESDYLLRMLARVEGMPVESLREGVPWDWRSTSDYLGAVEPKLGINAAFMVGHSAVRRLVMGPEAIRHVQVLPACRWNAPSGAPFAGRVVRRRAGAGSDPRCVRRGPGRWSMSRSTRRPFFWDRARTSWVRTVPCVADVCDTLDE
jgi:hypothetical protein